jgi:hypothetical protein
MKNLLMKLVKKVFFASVFFAMCSYTTYGRVTSKEKGNGKSSVNSAFAIIPLASVISVNTTLTANNTYLLIGKVVVKNNAVLTIEAGTRILGIFKANATESSALIITRGSKIVANGTAARPIIFTGRVDGTNPSLSPGDWGGIVILGNAPTNRTVLTLIEGISVPSLPTGVTNDDVSLVWVQILTIVLELYLMYV